ncbi:hypothetical protein DMC63_37730 [Streptomyces sp. WAC 05977]|nr:hypothetical protein DMC63_37730 [Streptomyces sp. WAC 05977]
MSRTASQLRAALENARTDPIDALALGISESEARGDRAAAIADLEARLAEREAEEAGSWNGIAEVLPK